MTDPDSGVPRWVKLAVITGVLVAVVVVVVLLMGGGGGHVRPPH